MKCYETYWHGIVEEKSIVRWFLCQQRSALVENERMTGKQFSNIRSGRNRTSMNCCALSFCSMSQQRNGPGKQELLNDPCDARPCNLKSMAWRACSSKLHSRVSQTNRAVFPQICANSLLISKQSILAFAPMKSPPSVFCVLVEDPLPIPSSTCSLMAPF